MTIPLRFIPTLLEETDKIMKAQMARGGLESGQYHETSQKLDPTSGAFVYQCVPIAQESCYGNWEARVIAAAALDQDEWDEAQEEDAAAVVLMLLYLALVVSQSSGLLQLLTS